MQLIPDRAEATITSITVNPSRAVMVICRAFTVMLRGCSICSFMTSRTVATPGTGIVSIWLASPETEIRFPATMRFAMDELPVSTSFGHTAELLAVMEEGLRHRGLGAVIGEAKRADMTATRRLQLAAEGGRTIALLMKRHAREDSDPIGMPSAAMVYLKGSSCCVSWPERGSAPAIPRTPSTTAPSVARTIDPFFSASPPSCGADRAPA